MESEHLLSAVQAAVTPVVLISAAAILCGGISQKHSDLGTRIRTLMAELRKGSLTEVRRKNLHAQVDLFRRRTNHATRAHLCLYSSILPYVAMIGVLLFGASRVLAVGLLIGGVALMTAAIVCEILELSLAARTMKLAIEDDVVEP